MITKNAIIRGAQISCDEPGYLTVWLQLDYDGGTQAFGGWALYLPPSWKYHKVEGTAGHFIFRCMEIAGVSSWDDMPGKTLRVRKESELGKIVAIGHIVKDDWFDPQNDFAELK